MQYIQCTLSLIVYTVNSHPFLLDCRRTCDVRMNAIKMIAAIMAMPTSTQLARTDPTTMPIELPFDDEPYIEIQKHR